MKRILVFTLVATMVLSCIAFSASALAFADLAENHWAYADVQTLVGEGTVSGYEDGTFRPNGTVTRAEFVKMLGEGPVLRERAYDDVQEAHWAYAYIMKSGLPEDGTNKFQPNLPLTRGLAAEMLWNRNGAEKGIFAPAIITSQYEKNADAIAWAYTTGLMKGDDGVSLRTDGTLTRAEAAALIIRARRSNPEKLTFAETVSPKIMENVYTGLSMFDKAYAPDATVTNGELARAALRIGLEEYNLSYADYFVSVGFEHEYAKDVTIVFGTNLGKEGIDATFADKTATFGDAAAALVYQTIAKSHKGLIYGEKTDGLPASVTSMMNVCLTFAKNNGIISLKESLDAPITVRELTALCLQLDQLNGLHSDITTDVHKITGKFVMKDHPMLLTEAPYGDFRAMLSGMPAEVYNTAFKNVKSTPDACYDFAREYSTIFSGILSFLQSSVKEKGATVRFTYYPSLVCENGNGFSMRVLCEVVSMNGTKSFSDIFPVQEGFANDINISTGSRIYLDLATGDSITSMQVTDEKVYVEQIVAY